MCPHSQGARKAFANRSQRDRMAFQCQSRPHFCRTECRLHCTTLFLQVRQASRIRPYIKRYKLNWEPLFHEIRRLSCKPVSKDITGQTSRPSFFYQWMVDLMFHSKVKETRQKGQWCLNLGMSNAPRRRVNVTCVTLGGLNVTLAKNGMRKLHRLLHRLLATGIGFESLGGLYRKITERFGKKCAWVTRELC
jgi:hypothetical protein